MKYQMCIQCGNSIPQNKDHNCIDGIKKSEEKTTGLTLIEAVKSGKRFRRNGWKIYCDPHDRLFHLDIMADDWELEPEVEQKIELSLSHARKVLDHTFDNLVTIRRILNELGFK